MKKIIAIAMVTMLMVTMVPQVVFAASGTDTWDGTTDVAWYTVDPTATSFTIDTAEELAGLAEIVNAGTDTFEGDTITLTTNIDLVGTEWTPIGTSDDPFRGIFDGENHQISNLEIDKSTADIPDNTRLGLFGQVKKGNTSNVPTLKNVSVLNVNIVGNYYIGGLVGKLNEGTIINCHTSGNIQAKGFAGGMIGDVSTGEIIKSSSSVRIEQIGSISSGGGLGGLVGHAQNSIIKYSHATGDVIGGASVGGLAGVGIVSTIENSYATGNVEGKHFDGSSMSTGGLVGWGRGAIIKNSYATGNVVGAISVGGLVGEASSGATLENSYAVGTVIATGDNLGGLYGNAETVKPTVTNSYGNNEVNPMGTGSNGNEYVTGEEGATIGQMRTAEFTVQLGAAFAYDATINDGFPYLLPPPIDSTDSTDTDSTDNAEVPATGDSTNLYGIMIMAIISVLGVCAVARRKGIV